MSSITRARPPSFYIAAITITLILILFITTATIISADATPPHFFPKVTQAMFDNMDAASIPPPPIRHYDSNNDNDYDNDPEFHPQQQESDRLDISSISLTDGEDTIFLQAWIVLHKTTSRFHMLDTVALLSPDSRLPDIQSVEIRRYTAASQNQGDTPVTGIYGFVNPSDTSIHLDYKIGTPLQSSLLNPSRDALDKQRFQFIMLKITLSDYVLLYPLTLQLSIVYNFERGSKLTPASPMIVSRYYFESFDTLYWYTPCQNEKCDETLGLTVMMEGWNSPIKDDSDADKKWDSLEVRQTYALKLQLTSENAKFIFNSTSSGTDLSCTLNYFKVTLITLGHDNAHEIIILLEDYMTNEFQVPLYAINTLYLKCPDVVIRFGYSEPKHYLLRVESGFVEKPTGWISMTDDEIRSKLRFITVSSYTDLWKWKRYTPQVVFEFKPNSYSFDGSTSVRGIAHYDHSPPQLTDRLIICGVEEASTVSFTVHQAVKNKYKETVWAIHTLPDRTSRSYTDPFDPAWDDSMYDTDEKQNEDEDDGSGGGKKQKSFSLTSITSLSSSQPQQQQHQQHNDPKYQRFLDKKQQFLSTQEYQQFMDQNPHFAKLLHQSWSTPRSQPIQSSHSQIIHHQPPSPFRQQQQQLSFSTLATPIDERICIRVAPFAKLERLTVGIYWFVVSFKLADQGDSYFINSYNTSPSLPYTPGNSSDNNVFETMGFTTTADSTTSTMTTLADDTSPTFMDIMYQLLGSHSQAGVGLYNWRFRGVLSLPKEGTIWHNKVPTYIPLENPRPNCDEKMSSEEFNQLSLVVESFQSLLFPTNDNNNHEEDDNTDTASSSITTSFSTTTNNIHSDPTPSPPPTFDQLYPFNAKLPPLYFQITNKDFIVSSLRSVILHTHGYHILSSKLNLMASPEKNYWTNPAYYNGKVVPHPLTCEVRNGAYTDDGPDPLKMAVLPVVSAYHVDTLFNITFSTPMVIAPAKGFDGVYIDCPDLYLISEGFDTFVRKTMVAVLFYDTADEITQQQQLQFEPEPLVQPRPFAPSSLPTMQSNPKAFVEMMTEHHLTRNPLVEASYWAVSFELTQIEGAEKAPQLCTSWPESWYNFVFSRKFALWGSIIGGLTAVLLALIAFTCIRACCCKRSGWSADDEDDDNDYSHHADQDDVDVASLEIQRYNNQLKMNQYNYGLLTESQHNNFVSGSYNPPPSMAHSLHPSSALTSHHHLGSHTNSGEGVASGFVAGIDAAANIQDHYGSPTVSSTASTTTTALTPATPIIPSSNMSIAPTTMTANTGRVKSNHNHPTSAHSSAFHNAQMNHNQNHHRDGNNNNTKAGKKIKNNYGDFL